MPLHKYILTDLFLRMEVKYFQGGFRVSLVSGV